MYVFIENNEELRFSIGNNVNTKTKSTIHSTVDFLQIGTNL